MSTDTSEDRGSGMLEMDFSDFVEVNPLPTVTPTASRFKKAAELAGRANVKQLASADSRIAAAEIGELVNKYAEKLLEERAASNPRLKRFAINVTTRAYIKAPPGLYKEPAKIVSGWLDGPERALTRTGKSIVETLREKYAGYSIRADFMSRPLHWAQRKYIQTLLRKHKVEASITQCATLSSIKQLLLDLRNPPTYDTYKPVIQFARDGSHLIWNGDRHRIFLNKGAPSIKRGGKTVAVSAIRKIAEG
ncbi:MAG: hypothetical protein ACK4SJ_00430 [Sphingorhabdus sp.]